MNMVINVDGELFDVSDAPQPGGTFVYHFTWTSGPANGTYGFTVGGRARAVEALERAARGFLRSFFEPGSIGVSDFPAFTESRKRSGT